MNFLKDGDGNDSSMRLMAFISVLMGCSIALLAVALNRDLTGAGVLVAAILAPGFAGKAWQSREELKHDN